MKDRIIEHIRQYVDEGIEITDESEFFKDLGLSSLDMVTLLFSVEKMLDAKIDIMDFIGIKTVGELIQVINAKYSR